MRRNVPRPTRAEHQILRLLWRHGPGSVRELKEEQGIEGTMSYTTLLKLLQIMLDKGLVVRDESRRAHLYRARYTQDEVQREMVRDLRDRIFEGSTAELVLRALSAQPASPEELAEIRRLLDEMEGTQP